MELATKKLPMSEGQLKAWVAQKLGDPKWVAKMKARSDKSDAQMRSRGLL